MDIYPACDRRGGRGDHREQEVAMKTVIRFCAWVGRVGVVVLGFLIVHHVLNLMGVF